MKPHTFADEMQESQKAATFTLIQPAQHAKRAPNESETEHTISFDDK
jgi:hypothetical protein